MFYSKSHYFHIFTIRVWNKAFGHWNSEANALMFLSSFLCGLEKSHHVKRRTVDDVTSLRLCRTLLYCWRSEEVRVANIFVLLFALEEFFLRSLYALSCEFFTLFTPRCRSLTDWWCLRISWVFASRLFFLWCKLRSLQSMFWKAHAEHCRKWFATDPKVA